MTVLQLLACVRRLDPKGPLTDELAKRLRARRKWYRNERQHWIGWLREYDGPGAYDRRDHARDARGVYQRIQCPTMLFWLAEAAGVPEARLRTAANAVCATDSGPEQCGALRLVIPWTVIESRLTP